jgi:hypothetical protein
MRITGKVALVTGAGQGIGRASRKGPPALSADRVRAAHIDNLLDEALKQTFPASDPIAIAVDAVYVAHTEQSDKGHRP